MQCYACSNEATRQCHRCARVYCELHGGDLCAECMSPASSLPSFNLYRGSLLALLVGTAVALWLIVQPPGTSDSTQVELEITPSPVVTEQPDRTGTPERTPSVTRTPTAQASPTVEPRTYIVQEGDTLFSIAETFAPPGADPVAYAEQIASANNFAVDATLSPGQTLVLP